MGPASRDAGISRHLAGATELAGSATRSGPWKTGKLCLDKNILFGYLRESLLAEKTPATG